MIVIAGRIPVRRWPSASHRAASTVQITLPITEPGRARPVLTAVQPNGHRANDAVLNDCVPNGLAMIRISITIPANPTASQKPASSSRMMLRVKCIVS
jgi:hypothetical protein